MMLDGLGLGVDGDADDDGCDDDFLVSLYMKLWAADKISGKLQGVDLGCSICAKTFTTDWGPPTY